MHLHVMFVLYLLVMVGVFGAETEDSDVVSAVAGESVTLHTDIAAMKRNGHIVWVFGSDSPGTTIAEIIKWSYMLSIYVRHKEPFRDQLRLDHQTGSLTIKNITTGHSGLYKLTITTNKKTSFKSFSIKVYDFPAHLPIPVITSDSSQNCTASARSSGPKCVLLCSVRNASLASLSFYKGHDLLSNISGSAFSTILSLSLEVEYYDQNTYSCVVSNFNSNQTTHVNAADVCQTHSEISWLYFLVLLMLIPVVVIVTVWIVCVCRKHRKAKQQADENC